MRLAAVALLLLLAGCAADPSDSVVASSHPTPPRLEAHDIIADDGAKLPLRSWLPEGKPRAVIIALHGMNDYSNAFTHPGEDWAKAGIATYAYDQRGFGAAPERGSWAGSERLAQDLTDTSRLLRQRYPGTPLYLLGESMGGAVVTVAVTGASGAPRPEADGIILSAPAIWDRGNMNVFERVALWGGNALFPSMTLTGQGLEIKPSDNIEMLRELGRDPEVIKETRVDAIKGLVDLMDLAFDAAPQITLPVLVLHGMHDELVPETPTRLFIAHLPAAEKAEQRIAWYDQGYHLLLRDLHADIVRRDVEAWIGNRSAALPSGADRRARDGLMAQK